MKPPIPLNEGLRLATLAGYRILDTPPEPAFDEITALAAAICGTPIAMVSLVDKSRQWFKAKVGTDVSETSRMIAFCAHTICEPDMLLVTDALKDERFVDNPLVTGELGVRFYAGVPLISPEGLVMGAICVLDQMPRELDEAQKMALRVLGRRVMDQMELRRQILAQKKQATERSSVFMISDDLLSISDMEGRMVEVNPAWTRCLGWSSDELTGKRWLDFVLPEDQEVTLQVFSQLASGEPIKYFENRYRCKDGTYRWLSWSSHQLVEARQFFSVARDVTEHKREEIALMQSNRAWRLFSRCNEASILATTEKELVDSVCRIIVDEGEFCLAWVGYAMDDKAKSTVPQAHAGRAGTELPEIPLTWAETDPLSLSSKIIQSGESVNIPDLEAGEHFRPWKSFERKHGLFGAVGLPLKEQNRTFGVLMLYQSGQIPIPESELRLLRELADNLAFGIVNLRTNEELRKTHDSVLAMSHGVYNSFSGEFYEKLVLNVVKTLEADMGCIAMLNHGKASATTICAVIDGELVENFEYSLDGTPCEKLLLDEICYVPEDVSIHFPKAGMLAQGNFQAYAGAKLYNVAGQPIGLLFLLFRQPISQRAFISSTLRLFSVRASDELERIRYEKQFLRAQRMESIGTLAGGIAHDINNVLTPIIMSIDLLRMYVNDPDGINILDMVGASARRGADMVKQVLSFARGEEINAREMQIAPIIDDLLRIVQETFSKNIQIESQVQSDIWQIKVDATQIHQVLLNFCVNARDAMPDGGLITLKVQNLMVDENEAAMNIDAHPGPYVTIQAQDTGPGISQDIIEKIFDPFFTTKEPGSGTGLGLSTSLTIIKNHGGFVRVWSNSGEGACFRIYLPAITSPGRALEIPSAEEIPQGHGETVLVVDDEPFVRQVTKQTLEAYGYKVLLAAEGSEAVSMYVKHQHEIAVVLVDMMMPVMDGQATIMTLRQINPSARIICASGINTKSNVSKATKAGAIHFLPKPFTAETLLKTIFKALTDLEVAPKIDQATK